MKTEVELRGLNDGGRVVVLGAVVSQVRSTTFRSKGASWTLQASGGQSENQQAVSFQL